MTCETISPQAQLLRGFAFDFLSCHDLAVVPRIMDPLYRLAIGRHVLNGRDSEYLPATAAQLEQFPGLCVTVHDVMLGVDVVAMRFTEHGISRRHRGRAAAWGGVTMFRIENGRFKDGWAEEDYFARKRQLAADRCDPVNAPHPTPWDVAVEPPEKNTADTIHAWLRNRRALEHESIDEISPEGPTFAQLIAVEELHVEHLFPAGGRAAVRVLAQGRYAGGFADIDAAQNGREITLTAMGIASVQGGEVSHVHLACDRLGLHRFLLDEPATPHEAREMLRPKGGDKVEF